MVARSDLVLLYCAVLLNVVILGAPKDLVILFFTVLLNLDTPGEPSHLVLLSVVFFFKVVIYGELPDLVLLITGEIIIVARLVEPFMAGMWIYIFAGISVGSFLVFFPGFITRIRNREEKTGFDFGIAIHGCTGI